MPPKSVTKKPAAKGAAASKKTTAPAKGAAKAPAKAPAKKPAAADPPPAAAKVPEKEPEEDPIEVPMKAIKDEFIEDKQQHVRGPNKVGTNRPAALVIDREDNLAIRFLRMAGPGFIDALELMSPDKDEETAKEQIRLVIINSIRQGKPVVINLDRADNEVFVRITELFNKLEPELMEKVQNRTILKDEWYMKLVKESDGEAFSSWYFSEENNEKFFLVLVTQFKTPTAELKKNFTVFKIKED